MNWYASNHRPMPWKGEKNPYRIWLSEIILQQTRVEQGLPYYERFCKQYPTVTDLANAPEDDVMKLWEGLGYYSRARNLHAAAKYIATALDGVFPTDYEGIQKLKGVGPYTAAAIASFAYDLPYAVVDGNVYRVLSRIFGIQTPIDSTPGKKEFASLAQALLDAAQPGAYNQAIMDFGAVHCTPRQPRCESCSLQAQCSAFAENKVQELPVKTKKISKKTRYFDYWVINCDGAIFLRKRSQKDIWQHLYEFPMVESDAPKELDELLSTQSLLSPEYFVRGSKPFQQMLTHQKIIARFWEFEVPTTHFIKKEDWMITHRKKLLKFAFPKIIDRYLQDNSLYLELH